MSTMVMQAVSYYKEAERNRWLIALSAMGIHLCIGSVYAWSVLVNPIQQAIRSLAGEIGIKTTEKKGKTTKGVSLNKIVKAINENEELGKAFEELFGVKLDIKSIKGNEAEFENFALPTYLLKDRIDESGIFASSPVEEMYYCQ